MENSNLKSSRNRFDDNDIPKLKAALKEGAAKHKPLSKTYSMKTLIHLVRDELIEMRNDGYTVDQLCDFIINGGFNRKRSTLRHHIGASTATTKRSRQSGTAKTKRTHQSSKRKKPQPASVQSVDSGKSPQPSAGTATVNVIPDRVKFP